jgi:hypothetical protein
MDSYVSWAVRTLLAPMMVLAGYAAPRTKRVVLSLTCLSEDRRKQMLILGNNLFPNQIPDFEQGGRLHPMYLVVLATVLMHFEHMCNKYGEDDHFVNKLITSMQDHNHPVLTDSLEEPSIVLLDISRQIRSNFHYRIAQSKAEASTTDPVLLRRFQDALEQVEQLNTEIGKLRTEKRDMEASNHDMKHSLDNTVNAVGAMLNKINTLLSSGEPGQLSLHSNHTVSPSDNSSLNSVTAQVENTSDLPSPCRLEGSLAVEQSPLVPSPDIAANRETTRPQFKVPRRPDGGLQMRGQQTLLGMLNPAARLATHQVQLSRQARVSNLKAPPLRRSTFVSYPPPDGNATLSELLEGEHQRGAFRQLHPFKKIVGNHGFDGGNAQEKTKFRTALCVAFHLLDPHHRVRMVSDVSWERDGDDGWLKAFEEVNEK